MAAAQGAILTGIGAALLSRGMSTDQTSWHSATQLFHCDVMPNPLAVHPDQFALLTRVSPLV